MLLIFIIYLKNKENLLKRYLIFLLLYTFYLLIFLFNLYNITIANNLILRIYVITNSLYFIWFFFFVYHTPFFFHELLSIPFTRIKKYFFGSVSIISLILLIIPFILKNNLEDILKLMKFELLGIIGVFFIALLFYVIFLLLKYRKKIENEVKKKISNSICILAVIFLPGFIIDSFSQQLQIEWKLLPFGLEFSILFYLVLNIINIKIMLNNYLDIFTNKNIDWNINIEKELTSREKEIINLIIKGNNSKEIGTKLFLSDKTVRNHVSNVYRKTQCRNRVELVKKFALH